MSLLSIIIPTRDRAKYLASSVRTALQSREVPVEVIILDNASVDNTSDVCAAIKDERVRYLRSESRLSMRDNFERGLAHADGDYIAFIGDDDGLLGDATRFVFEEFRDESIMAVMSRRAHYFWPDLIGSRASTGLMPRWDGVERLDSRQEIRDLLEHSDYYRLPCIYHGFVRRKLISKASKSRFFLSSQVDIYSAIALSMEGVAYVFSHQPLIINGGSSRSNGASHFGGGTNEERERFRAEDELGFLPGFEAHATVGSLIVESAVRYADAFGLSLTDIFPRQSIDKAMARELGARIALGRGVDVFAQAAAAAGSPPDRGHRASRLLERGPRLLRSIFETMPIDFRSSGIETVAEAARYYDQLIAMGSKRNFRHLFDQIMTSIRIARN